MVEFMRFLIFFLILLFVAIAFILFFVTEAFLLEAFLEGWTVGSSIDVGDVHTEGGSDAWK